MGEVGSGSEPSEHIQGSIQVKADIRAGSEYLRIFFSDRRMIMAYIGKRGMGNLSAVTFFGDIGSKLEALFRGPGESRRKKKMQAKQHELSPEELLEVDKNNFGVGYDEVVKVTLERTPYSVNITLLTRDEKYQFSTREQSTKVLELFQGPLAGRVLVTDRDLRRVKK